MFNRSICVAVFALAQLGCSDVPTEETSTEDTFTGIQLALSMESRSGKEYRLSPATFGIGVSGTTGPLQLVEASADVTVVNTPVEPGQYTVTLQPGWVLNRVLENGSLTPIPATLNSPVERTVLVDPNETELVNFTFSLGQSSIAVGAVVEEGDFYTFIDGSINERSPGKYEVTIYGAAMDPVCCFTTIEEARAAYPWLNLQAPN
jgi:hypothetical protein